MNTFQTTAAPEMQSGNFFAASPKSLSWGCENFCSSIFSSPVLNHELAGEDRRRNFEENFPSLPSEDEFLSKPPLEAEKMLNSAQGKEPVCTPMTTVSMGEATPMSPTGADGSKKCRCKKSQCLRLHCVCFSEGGYCGLSCGCTDCLNNTQFESARQFVIQKTKEINPLAFAPKVKKLDSTDKVLNSQGCKCNRNNCKKNYCECFKNGIGCSSVCRCNNCLNNKKILDKQEEEAIGGRIFRKKHKIIISQKELCNEEPGYCQRSITYVPHKKKIKKNTEVKV